MVAVLFTDLVGSTDLMSRIGEHAFDEVRRGHFAALGQAVERTGGQEIKNTGDGVMAMFGSVVDAIRCAIAMQQATERQARRTGAPISIRVGLSIGEATFEDYDVFGVPVVEAARLAAAAGSGQIVTTVIAKTLAAGRTDAEFADLGLLELKGLPQPLAALEVRWEPLPESAVPMPGMLTDVGPIFVGRDAELERLRQRWKEAVAGERRVALLAGEPGVGKTRLAAELAAQVQEDGATVLAGRCDEDLGVPYQPFVEALRHFVDHATAEDLAGHLGRYGGELGRLVPELAERVPDLSPPLQSDPETERYRLFDAVAAWLAAASAEEPLLLVLDDLQWAAKPTLLLLRHVVRSPANNRLLILGTYRDTELGHEHPLVQVVADLRRQGGVERISLTGLDSTGVLAFMEQSAGHGLDDEDLALARALHEETEGNPFFVREVLHHLIETGAIDRRQGRWGTRLPVEELGIPESIRDVVGRRLSRLSVASNRFLQTAAVVGPEFDIRVAEAASGFDEDAVLSSLEEATAARLVIEATNPQRYRFAHALVRDSLYRELGAARRIAVHRRVAEAIELIHASRLDDHLPALAHHWIQASAPTADPTKAVDYATRAGHRALAQLAHDEAVSYYRQALELFHGSGTRADAKQRCELLIVLGEAQRRAGDPGYRGSLLSAGGLAQDLADTTRLVRAALANRRRDFTIAYPVDADEVMLLEAALKQLGDRDDTRRAQLLASLATEFYFGGDDRRHVVAREALATARSLGDPLTLAQVLATTWFATWDPAGLADRAGLVDELWDCAQRLDDHLLQFDAGMALFVTAMQQADMRRADAGLEASALVAEALGQPVLRWRVVYSRAARAMAAGRLDDAERLAGEARRLGEALGQPAAIFHDVVLGMIRIIQGEPEQTVEIIEASAYGTMSPFRAGLAWAYADLDCRDKAGVLIETLRSDNGFDGVPRNHTRLMTLSFLSRACTRLDDTERSAELYDLLHPNRGEIIAAHLAWFGPVAHDLGLLATTLGRHDAAETHFAEAADLQQRIGARATLVHTHLEWARMLLIRRQPYDAERARELLDLTVAAARELGLANVERRAIALLQ